MCKYFIFKASNTLCGCVWGGTGGGGTGGGELGGMSKGGGEWGGDVGCSSS